MAENIALTEAVYYILLVLQQPMHGYAIMQRVEELSGGRVRLAAGTLYGALANLSQKRWVEELPGEAGSRRREYRIAQAGREVLAAELKRLEELVKNGRAILADGREGT